MIDDRFQNQTWYVKLWRLRYRLLIPYWFVRSFFQKNTVSARCRWSLYCGIADVKMNYIYTMEEVRERLDKRLYARKRH